MSSSLVLPTRDLLYPHLWDGCVAAWSPGIQGPGGLTLRDLSGNGHDGDFVNMSVADWVGNSGTSLSFPGSTDYVDHGQAGDFAAWDTISVSFWLYYSATPASFDFYIGKNRAPAADLKGWRVSNGPTRTKLRMLIVQGASNELIVDSADAVLTSGWQHIMATYHGDGSTITMCRNGEGIATTVDTNTLAVSDDIQHAYPFSIGGRAEDEAGSLDGQLDDLRLHSRPLDPYAKQLWNGGERNAAYLRNHSRRKHFIVIPSLPWDEHSKATEVARYRYGGVEADLTHPINKNLLNWYALNHGEQPYAVDIGPRGESLAKSGSLVNGTEPAWQGKELALRSAAVSSSDNSSFSGTAESTRNLDEPRGITIAGWVWITHSNVANNYLFSEVGSGNQRLRLQVSNNTPSLYTQDNAGTARTMQGSTLSLGQWHFIAATQYLANGVLYQNGVQTATNSGLKHGGHDANISRTVALSSDGSPSGSSYVRYWNIRVWDRELSASEILELYRDPLLGLTRQRQAFFVPTIAPEDREEVKDFSVVRRGWKSPGIREGRILGWGSQPGPIIHDDTGSNDLNVVGALYQLSTYGFEHSMHCQYLAGQYMESQLVPTRVTNKLTVSVWYWVETELNTNFGAVHRCTDSNYGWAFAMESINNVWKWYVGNGTSYGSVAGPDPANDWHKWVHLVGTWDGTTMEFFRNGVSVGTTAHSGTTCAPVVTIRQGWDHAETSKVAAYGFYHDTNVWNRVLSAQEIAQVWNNGKPDAVYGTTHRRVSVKSPPTHVIAPRRELLYPQLSDFAGAWRAEAYGRDTAGRRDMIATNMEPSDRTISALGGAGGHIWDLDGVNEYLTTYNGSHYNLMEGQAVFSVSWWASVDALANSKTMVKEGLYFSYGMSSAAGRMGGSVRTSTGTFTLLEISTDNLITGKLYHHLIVFNSITGEHKYYRDGDLIRTQTYACGPIHTDQSTSFQISDSTAEHNGLIDDVIVWHREITFAEQAILARERGIVHKCGHKPRIIDVQTVDVTVPDLETLSLAGTRLPTTYSEGGTLIVIDGVLTPSASIDNVGINATFPGVWTTLQYSLNSSDWFSYTNSAPVALGTISTETTTYFRGTTPNSTSVAQTFDVDLIASGDSVSNDTDTMNVTLASASSFGLTASGVPATYSDALETVNFEVSFDPDGLSSNTLASGDFPAGWSTLEYSTDSGGAWSSYTDNSFVTLGTLNAPTMVNFRGNTPNPVLSGYYLDFGVASDEVSLSTVRLPVNITSITLSASGDVSPYNYNKAPTVVTFNSFISPSDTSVNTVATATFPSGMTTLESSIDSGGNWLSYTNGADVSLATNILVEHEVRFRGTTPATPATSYLVTMTSSSDNDDGDTSVSVSGVIRDATDLHLSGVASPTTYANSADTITVDVMLSPSGLASTTEVFADFPAGWTTLEYSTDSGGAWNAYNDASGVLIGQTCDNITTNFRGNAPTTLAASYDIYVSGVAENIAVENDTVTVTLGTSSLTTSGVISPSTYTLDGTVETLIAWSTPTDTNIGTTMAGTFPATWNTLEYSTNGTDYAGYVNSSGVDLGQISSSTATYFRGTTPTSPSTSYSVSWATNATNASVVSGDVTVNLQDATTLNHSGVVDSLTYSNSDTVTFTNYINPDGKAENTTVGVDFPNDWGTLEYSTNGGGSWITYYDASGVNIGTTSSLTETLFRGITPASPSSTYEVTTSGNSDQTSHETDTINLTLVETEIYLTASGNPEEYLPEATTLTTTAIVDPSGTANNVIVFADLPDTWTTLEYSINSGSDWAGYVDSSGVILGNISAINDTIRFRGTTPAEPTVTYNVDLTSSGDNTNVATDTATFNMQNATNYVLVTSGVPTTYSVDGTDTIIFDHTITPSGQANNTFAKADFPAGWATLEYSTDGGSVWNSYTDNASVSLGTVTQETHTKFRGTVPASPATSYDVNLQVGSDELADSSGIVTVSMQDATTLVFSGEAVPTTYAGAGETIEFIGYIIPDGQSNNVLASGDFPVGWTTLEYSTDGGTGWSAYTDLSVIALGGISSDDDVRFRGDVPSTPAMSYDIDLFIQSDETSQETDTITVMSQALSVSASGFPTTYDLDGTVLKVYETISPNCPVATGIAYATFPGAFTTLEYSLNDSDWAGYVNSSGISLGDYSSDQTVYYRGTSPSSSPSLSYVVTAYGNGAENSLASGSTTFNMQDATTLGFACSATPNVFYTGGTTISSTVTITPDGQANNTLASGLYPGTWGTLEYSTNGSDWAGYVNGSGVMLGTITEETSTYFRGNVPDAPVGNYTIYLYATSDETGTESSSELITNLVPELAVSGGPSPNPYGTSLTTLVFDTVLTPTNTPSNVFIVADFPATLGTLEYSTDGGGIWASYTDDTQLVLGTIASETTVKFRGVASDPVEDTYTVLLEASGDFTDLATDTVIATLMDATDLGFSASRTPSTYASGNQTIEFNGTLDPDGQLTNGVIKTDFPATWTTLEYSTNGGSVWNSYTDNTYISVGTIKESTTVLFRGDTPSSPTGSYMANVCGSGGGLPESCTDLSISDGAGGGYIELPKRGIG